MFSSKLVSGKMNTSNCKISTETISSLYISIVKKRCNSCITSQELEFALIYHIARCGNIQFMQVITIIPFAQRTVRYFSSPVVRFKTLQSYFKK